MTHGLVSHEMKYLILVLFFLILPIVLFQQLIVPALESLENTYRNADIIARNVAE